MSSNVYFGQQRIGSLATGPQLRWGIHHRYRIVVIIRFYNTANGGDNARTTYYELNFFTIFRKSGRRGLQNQRSGPRVATTIVSGAFDWFSADKRRRRCRLPSENRSVVIIRFKYFKMVCQGKVAFSFFKRRI